MQRILILAFVTLTLIAGAAPRASAQSGSSIAGVVKDTTGAVLPGVTVEAASPALIEKVRTVVSDAAGQFKVVDLRPGSYTVTFTLPGFGSVKREGIELIGTFAATVNADLRVGSVEETITVSGSAPTVDVQNVVQQRVMTRDVLDGAPLGTKQAAAVGALIPGVIASSQDVGGTQFTAASIAIHGGRSGEMLILFDGMDASNGQGRGGAYTTVQSNDAAVQELGLQTSGLSAESELGGIRTNLIPKDGGNLFKGSFFANYTNDNFQGDNLTDRLKARGANSVNKVQRIFDVNPGGGGPLAKDKLWFFAAARKFQARLTQAGLFYNASPVPYAYVADLSRPAYETTTDGNISLRLTWQASPKNKISAQHQYATQTFDHYYAGNTTLQPDATLAYDAHPQYFSQASWSSPATSRLLLEGGASFGNKDYVWTPQPGADPNAFAYTEQNTGLTWGNAIQTLGHHGSHNYNARFSATYVTGSHAAKIGVSFLHSSSHWEQWMTGNEMTLQLLGGNPSRVTVFAFPVDYDEVTKANVGLFGQDQWTLKQLTLNVGVRFDYLNNYVPAQHNGPGPQVPNRNVDFPQVDNVPNWKNVSPRLGASYDLFGNGKTALKVSLGRYLEGPNLTAFTRLANPAAAIAVSAQRTWVDSNGDFLPQESELGAFNQNTFGNSTIVTTYAPDVLTTRGYNWEFSAALQHELMPRVSMNVAYFRRSYGNLRVTQNTAVTSADYSPYCVTAPLDARLPNGGGNQLCGYFDVNPDKFGRTLNVIQEASHFGTAEDVYDGVDLTEIVRLPGSINVSGGVSIGRERTNNCYALNDLSLMSAFGGARLQSRCDVRPPFQPNVKFLVVYPLPFAGIQAGAAFQSIPGPQILASYTASNALIAPSLGRNLAAGAGGNAVIDLIPPATQYGERLNQLDLRASKIFRLPSGRSLQANVDIYNALNVDTVLQQNNTFGALWQKPSSILQARFLKFSFQVQF
ncbi:MAG: TonB-dependent receptor [Acidobacteriota bacterium]